MNEKDCFKKGLLKKTQKQTDLAIKDLNQTEFFLKETKDLLKINKEHIAALTLYNAYFHTARALLFKDGIKERSHYCIARYIEEHYDLEEFVNAFETMMSTRHNVQYSTEKINIDENLNEFIKICEKYKIIIKKMIK